MKNPGGGCKPFECRTQNAKAKWVVRAFQGLGCFWQLTQGRIGAHLPLPIQPWAGGRNPDGILRRG
ncbi:hypothetical protein SBV1_1410006 [Verrucomicrobia bacterium]|nr:hypothetical protein SBV1_1410006 [Verrucomicrobiota bacterium]